MMRAEKPLNVVLKDMNVVNKVSKKSGLKSSKLKGSDAAASRLVTYFNITKTQVYLLTVTFFLNLKRMSADINDVGSYLEMDEDDLICLIPDFNELVSRKFLKFTHLHYREDDSLLNRNIKLTQPLSVCIFANNPISEMDEEAPMDIFKFVHEVSELIDNRQHTEYPSCELFAAVKTLEKDHPDLALPAELIAKSVGVEDRVLFYEMCDDVVSRSNTALVETLELIYDNVRLRLLKSKEVLAGTDALSRHGLIRLKSAQMLADADVELSDKAMEMFLGEYLMLFCNDFDREYLKPERLTKKELFFDDELSKQLGFLQDNLQQDHYLKLQDRLAQLGMPKGIAAILYGEPGTGKTESVYQIARETGRGIVHVNISETKSMWFGESEKKIKEVFSKYERICKHSTIKPILLFNEADAVFGKRKEVGKNNVDQTENAIQNIILEEMEKLEGILIATTNLASNLDAAFERRFLFKIRFGKPSLEVNEKIWRNKLDWLDEVWARELARNYAFSGGEIDNVVRKVAMEEVLTGLKPGLDGLAKFCEAEKLSGRGLRKKVGFVN